MYVNFVRQVCGRGENLICCVMEGGGGGREENIVTVHETFILFGRFVIT